MQGPDGAASTKDEALSLYERGLRDVVEALIRAGIGVVIIQNLPELPHQGNDADVAQRLDEPSIFRRLVPRDIQVDFDPQITLAGRESVALGEARIAGTQSGVVLLDPVDRLCTDSQCAIAVSGKPVFFDSWHLTRDGAMLLVPELTAAIDEALRGVTARAERPS